MNKRSKSKGIVSNIVTIVLTALTVYFLLTFFSAQMDIKRLSAQLESSKAELEELDREKEALRQQKDKLSDPAYMEDYARGNYMLSQEGEQIFILPQR